MKRNVLRMVIAFGTLLFPGATASQARQLTLKERVEAQRAIEQIYWSHRIWPKDNTEPKPNLSAVMSESALEAKVEDYLRESNALQKTWKRPITHGQLQAEMRRIAVGTKASGALQEIFKALNSDPFLIAETLARQTLANRLIRSWYARDERFHGSLRRRAEEATRRSPSLEGMKSAGGDYRETTWEFGAAEDKKLAPDPKPNVIHVDAQERADLLKRLAARFGLDEARFRAGEQPLADTTSIHARLLDSLPVARLSGVQEEDDAFVVTAILEKGQDRLRVATAKWEKTSFDSWWASDSRSVTSTLNPPPGSYGPLASLAGEGCIDDTWRPVLQDWSEPSYGHRAVWTGTEMLVWGGSLASLGAKYDPATDTWTPISTAGAPNTRLEDSVVWTGTEMIVWGPTWNDTPTGGRYNPVTDRWKTVSNDGAPPVYRYGPVFTAIWTGTEMLLWGASQDYISGVGWKLIPKGARYNPSTDKWTSINTLEAPGTTDHHVAVWTGREMIVWGVHWEYDSTTGNNIPAPKGGRYNPSTDTWTPTRTVGAPVIGGTDKAIWTGKEMIVWGGDYFRFPGVGARYNPTTDTWVPMSTLGAPNGRSDHTLVWTGTEMIVWGGGAQDDIQASGVYFFNTGARYDPVKDAWTATTTVNAPSPRDRHTAIWTGTEMVVYGGHFCDWDDGDDCVFLSYTLNTGGRYDPVTDSWVPTNAGSAPGPTTFDSSVWTGSEMIVWGGFGHFDGGRVNTGGRYDPITDSWARTSILGAPSARSSHTAVWTGSEMIVWGGEYSQLFELSPGGFIGYLNSGGRYDPATDTWVATSTPGSPSPRTSHTAVWTGSEMIVWGGTNIYLDDGWWRNALLDSGGRYDPVTDTWLATSAEKAPTGRFGHTAVWDGDEMILWGGQSDAWPYLVTTGGRYDPASDVWIPTNTVGAPDGRRGHTAVWTGNEMVVWGGEGYLMTGARYDPGSDSWSSTSIVGAPTGRQRHSAVSVGTEMIVWGGESGSAGCFFYDPCEGTGGRYRPATDTWTSTSMIGQPSVLWGHSAVSTGTEMLVWGGASDYAYESTPGGRYCACESGPTVYVDRDGDGYGDQSLSGRLCGEVPPAGYSFDNTDCDDTDPAIHPGAAEICNSVDDDCDGSVDEGLAIGRMSIVLTPSILWPPNHRLVDVHATVTNLDGCSTSSDPVTLELISVVSSEPDDAPGEADGHTTSDIQGALLGTADFALSLRAERSDTGPGRTYTVTYRATDASGNSKTATALVTVPVYRK